MSEKFEKPEFRYEQESQADRLARKSKEMPVFPLGNYTEILVNSIRLNIL